MAILDKEMFWRRKKKMNSDGKLNISGLKIGIGRGKMGRGNDSIVNRKNKSKVQEKQQEMEQELEKEKDNGNEQEDEQQLEKEKEKEQDYSDEQEKVKVNKSKKKKKKKGKKLVKEKVEIVDLDDDGLKEKEKDDNNNKNVDMIYPQSAIEVAELLMEGELIEEDMQEALEDFDLIENIDKFEKVKEKDIQIEKVKFKEKDKEKENINKINENSQFQSVFGANLLTQQTQIAQNTLSSSSSSQQTQQSSSSIQSSSQELSLEFNSLSQSSSSSTSSSSSQQQLQSPSFNLIFQFPKSSRPPPESFEGYIETDPNTWKDIDDDDIVSNYMYSQEEKLVKEKLWVELYSQFMAEQEEKKRLKKEKQDQKINRQHLHQSRSQSRQSQQIPGLQLMGLDMSGNIITQAPQINMDNSELDQFGKQKMKDKNNLDIAQASLPALKRHISQNINYQVTQNLFKVNQDELNKPSQFFSNTNQYSQMDDTNQNNYDSRSDYRIEEENDLKKDSISIPTTPIVLQQYQSLTPTSFIHANQMRKQPQQYSSSTQQQSSLQRQSPVSLHIVPSPNIQSNVSFINNPSSQHQQQQQQQYNYQQSIRSPNASPIPLRTGSVPGLAKIGSTSGMNLVGQQQQQQQTQQYQQQQYNRNTGQEFISYGPMLNARSPLAHSPQPQPSPSGVHQIGRLGSMFRQQTPQCMIILMYNIYIYI
ncbi:MAG: hypothetical protein EZS28_027884 [Streblomastix strix]|uniref:Brf1 TBP-binding domain-containing protein n=1 Tax=Streblomastix strix TaxID=222440 RepID=A0A5J4V1I3_9EUKA|nr:MAG: hypothetical protein EZS28_027884 [Streblomastix strix]